MSSTSVTEILLGVTYELVVAEFISTAKKTSKMSNSVYPGPLPKANRTGLEKLNICCFGNNAPHKLRIHKKVSIATTTVMSCNLSNL